MWFVLIASKEKEVCVKHSVKKILKRFVLCFFFLNHKNVNHRRRKRCISVFVSIRKFGGFLIVFGGEGEIKGAEKGIVLAKYCILQYQSFPTQ